LATAIAHGGELAGIDCASGVTIYLDAENGEGEIHRRVHTLGLPASGVRVADAGGLDLRRNLDLIEALAEEAPDLIVLDSFRSMTPGLDENDTKQTAAAIDPLRRLAHRSGTTILLIHHANKAGRDFRGASSIRDSVDVLWHMGRQDTPAAKAMPARAPKIVRSVPSEYPAKSIRAATNEVLAEIVATSLKVVKKLATTGWVDGRVR